MPRLRRVFLPPLSLLLLFSFIGFLELGLLVMLSMALQSKKSVDDVWPVTGKRVLLRVDFNVPMKNGVITNDFRIRSAAPTIRRIIDQGGICILISHLGHPQGVDSDAVDADFHQRHNIVFQENRGKTAFFASLCGTDKSLLLSWSSKKDKAASLSSQKGAGKTAVFARLPEDEKRRLLSRFLAERKEHLFPQLYSTPGAEEDCSLQVVAVRLTELLGQHVYFAHDCLYAKSEIMKLRCGEVMLLENVCFYSNENSADAGKRLRMANILATYGDIYINDAFGTAHRTTSSISELPRVMGHGAAGYLMEKEIRYFAKLLGNPPRPLTVMVGGANASDKIKHLQNMLHCVDALVIGGSMAYTFLKAQGHNIGNSVCQVDEIANAQELLHTATGRNVTVYLPVDHVCHTEFGPSDSPHVTEGVDIPDGYMALDVGPRTVQAFSEVVQRSRCVVWNGLLGVFEMPCYAKATLALCRVMADCTASKGLLSIVGGADSVSAAEKSGEAGHLSHVSTGGTALLELLGGKILPGVAPLDNKD